MHSDFKRGQGFDQTGDFKKPTIALKAPDMSEILGEILELDAAALQVCEEDRNPEVASPFSILSPKP